MKKMLLLVGILSLSIGLGQTVIFSEDFESGTASEDWELFWPGEEAIMAVPMTSAPDTLSDGGNFVGMLSDADVSYTGAAIAVAGDVTLQNYSIEADVYCYVNSTAGSAYTGIVFYADSSHTASANDEFYYKLVADFDSSNRFRLYNNQLNTSTFQYSYHEQIDASGLYTTDAWHHMKVEVTTIDSNTTQFVCYFDELPLGSPQYLDTSDDVYGQGQFGVYAFQMGSALQGYFDNIIVTDLSTVSTEDERQLPSGFELNQNYPNPFNPTTTITYSLREDGLSDLTIYDLAGNTISTLISSHQTQGQYSVEWNGKDNFGNTVPSGVYIYALSHGGEVSYNKMMLLK